MHLGVFGGTFDPPHLGHLILASEAQSQLELDQVLFVLTPAPPHKAGQTVTPLEQRLSMLQAALGDAPGFRLSRVDIDRSPPHYAVDTVHLLRQQFPTAHLTYLMGGDSLMDLPIWHKPAEFVQECDSIGVMRRPGDRLSLLSLETKLPGVVDKIRFIQVPLLQISSSEIRQRILDGRPVRYFLPTLVYQHILSERLYSSQ